MRSIRPWPSLDDRQRSSHRPSRTPHLIRRQHKQKLGIPTLNKLPRLNVLQNKRPRLSQQMLMHHKRPIRPLKRNRLKRPIIRTHQRHPPLRQPMSRIPTTTRLTHPIPLIGHPQTRPTRMQQHRITSTHHHTLNPTRLLQMLRSHHKPLRQDLIADQPRDIQTDSTRHPRTHRLPSHTSTDQSTYRNPDNANRYKNAHQYQHDPNHQHDNQYDTSEKPAPQNTTQQTPQTQSTTPPTPHAPTPTAQTSAADTQAPPAPTPAPTPPTAPPPATTTPPTTAPPSTHSPHPTHPQPHTATATTHPTNHQNRHTPKHPQLPCGPPLGRSATYRTVGREASPLRQACQDSGLPGRESLRILIVRRFRPTSRRDATSPQGVAR